MSSGISIWKSQVRVSVRLTAPFWNIPAEISDFNCISAQNHTPREDPMALMFQQGAADSRAHPLRKAPASACRATLRMIRRRLTLRN